MSFFNEKHGVLHAEDVPLDEIARKAGTPCYVYSAGHIRAQYMELESVLKETLPPESAPLLCYACKANSHLTVLDILRRLGSGLEIVSEGELRRGLRAGFDPQKIVSTGVGKTESEIAACLKAGIYQINVESLPELEVIERIAGGAGTRADIVFRLNPDISGGGHDKISTGRKHDKFGLSREDVFKGFARAREMNHVHARGLSMHIGSQVFEIETFKSAFEKFPELVAGLRKEGHTLDRLDIGGGFPIQYKDEWLLDLSAYAEWVRDIIVPLGAQIVMEPGRYLVGNAGILLTEILYVKEAQERRFLIVDAAMNDMIRPMLYDSWHSIEPVANRDRPGTVYDVAGPVCESSDFFAKDRNLPEMRQGELAVIASAGAYGFCMASNYNSRPLPAEVLVSGGEFAVIRPRQSIESIMDAETVPDFIS